jgi:MSHA pilin protein MshA
VVAARKRLKKAVVESMVSYCSERRGHMKALQRGFTLVELIVVIVILGILAATALPRFVNLSGDARAAQMAAIAASMEAAKQLVQAKWLAAGSGTATSVNIDGSTVVNVITAVGPAVNGMPDTVAGGMANAITVPASSVNCTSAAGVFTCTYTGFAGCQVTYTRASGAVSAPPLAGSC